MDLIKKEVADKNRTRSMSTSTRITPSSFVTGEDVSFYFVLLIFAVDRP